MNSNNAKYFDSFGVEYIPKEIKKIIRNKNITTNIWGISVWFNVWVFGIGFIDFMLNNKNLAGFTNLFSLNNFEKNDEITFEYFL